MRLAFYLLLSLGVTFFTCLSVSAQQNNRWMFVGRDTEGTSFFLDVNSRQTVGNRIRIWDKNIFQDGSYRINLIEWRCGEKKYFYVDVTNYTPTGSVISKDKSAEWLNVIPDSISEGVHKAVCGSLSKSNSNAASATRKIAQIIVKKANLRTAPGMNSGVVQQTTLGSKFFLADEEPTNGWYQIILPQRNETAWIHGNNIKLEEANDKLKTKKRK